MAQLYATIVAKASQNIIEIVCWIATLLGLPLKSSRDRHGNVRNYAIPIWKYFLDITLLLCSLASFYLIYKLVPSTQLQLSVDTCIACGLISRVIFAFKRSEIRDTLKKIYTVSQAFNIPIFVSYKIIVACMIGYVAVLLFCISFFFFQQEYFNYRSSLEELFEISPTYSDLVTILAFAAIIFSFLVGGVTFGFVYFLCQNVYKALGDILHAFTDGLKKRLRMVTVSSSLLIKEIRAINEMLHLVKSADSALNLCALMIYIVFISLLFLSVSAVLSRASAFKSTVAMVYLGWNFITIADLLRKLTLVGSRVSEEGAIMKELVVVESWRFASNKETFEAFSILSNNLKGMKFVVTVGETFDVERKLFMTFISSMVTYGVILFQINS